MRHATAAKHADGGYHYASLSRRGGYPLGYCGEHVPHDTELEARECYTRYRRDHLFLDGQLGSWSDCSYTGCQEPTKSYAGIRYDGYAMAPLCPSHLTTEYAITALHLDKPAGDSWGSG